MDNLRWGTVTPLLANILHAIMPLDEFKAFRLVGGTNLSLKYGHRMSQDIDMFTDAPYGSIDYSQIEFKLKSMYPYFDDSLNDGPVGFGRMYYVGLNKDNCIKLDVMYTDPFFDEPEVLDNVRMATTDQIAAMKIQAINTGGRKKDWWDIHMLLDQYSLNDLLALHERWVPWHHERTALLDKLIDFSVANDDPDPVCLLDKDWDMIRLDIIDHVQDAAGRS